MVENTMTARKDQKVLVQVLQDHTPDFKYPWDVLRAFFKQKSLL